MAGTKSYEIQIYKDGDWKIQAFFDDQELALLEARRMTQTRRYPAVRVVEENWDPNVGEFRSRIVFRESEVMRHNEAVTQERAKIRREVQAQRQQRQSERSTKSGKRGGGRSINWYDNYYAIALKAIGIVGLGIIAIYGLQQLAG